MNTQISRLYTEEDLHELLLRVHTTAREKGWWTLTTAGHDSAELAKNAKCVLEDGDLEDKLFLIVCEMAEAFEEYRKPDVDVRQVYVVHRHHQTFEKTMVPLTDEFLSQLTSSPHGRIVVGRLILNADEAAALAKGKPEGFPIEMGDAYIRVLDLMGALDLVPEPVAIVDVGREPWRKPGKHLFKIMGQVAKADADPRRFLSHVLAGIEACCDSMGVDLAAAIETKAAYNKTRPVRHGGKRA